MPMKCNFERLQKHARVLQPCKSMRAAPEIDPEPRPNNLELFGPSGRSRTRPQMPMKCMFEVSQT
eukprot:5097470-Lingulodinium_polyedra.AAC.1